MQASRLAPSPGVAHSRPAESAAADEVYQRFWSHVGESFPDLGGAASTDYYRANEERLFIEHLGDLAGRRILKTDLWDEAKNTRILHWAAERGADVYGIDISEPTVRQARRDSIGAGGKFHVADCRRVPFRNDSFDAVYSMGTIEHFAESDAAVHEMWRVLKPRGRLLLGVPNRFDPFLRPLMVSALSAVGLYGYGYEKSFSRTSLRRMMTDCGFLVVAETAILFIPGWIRMLDLACHAWMPRLNRVTAAMVRPFAFLDRHWPVVRRHGYLLVTVGEKR